MNLHKSCHLNMLIFSHAQEPALQSFLSLRENKLRPGVTMVMQWIIGKEDRTDTNEMKMLSVGSTRFPSIPQRSCLMIFVDTFSDSKM